MPYKRYYKGGEFQSPNGRSIDGVREMCVSTFTKLCDL